VLPGRLLEPFAPTRCGRCSLATHRNHFSPRCLTTRDDAPDAKPAHWPD